MKEFLQLDFLGQLADRILATAPRPEPKAATTIPVRAKTGRDSQLEKRAAALLTGLGAKSLAGQVRVTWNPRMRSTAGTAYPRRGAISLNPKLREFGEAEIERTFLHELAHLLAHDRAGRRRIAPHGPEWQRACRDLGLPDEKRCHELPLPRREMSRRHLYRCPNCKVELRRVRPLKRKSACLECCRRHNGGRYDDRFRFVRANPG